MGERDELQDRFLADSGSVYMTGTDALVRLALEQRRRDRAAGLETAGFISGYRGSPLGTFDSALWRHAALLKAEDIVFRPGVNEELAATAVLGSQQASLLPGSRYQGVFGIWYGKGPGVDRAGDALKHGNLAGTSPKGGVLVLAGDDHCAKSSTTAHQSDQALIGMMIPVLQPAGVGEFVALGLHGIAMSRECGVWVGLKCLTEIVESGATVVLDDLPVPQCDPDLSVPHISLGLAPLGQEASMMMQRLTAVQAYARRNGLDGVRIAARQTRLGIVAAGKSYGDTEEALALLGLDTDRCDALGLSLYKITLVWPLEESGISDFAANADELLVVEEKRPVVEQQVASVLVNHRCPAGTRLSGKRDSEGRELLRAHGELSPSDIALAILRRLEAHVELDAQLLVKRQELEQRLSRNLPTLTGLVRSPAFCSGCPHNRSTKIPEGSVAFAGIGCHAMATLMGDRPTLPPVQMGGEGANWIGISPFSDVPHVFQNLGDGTYFHSGLLAVRASVAAGVNITYKILLNDAVAMTGGQAIDGQQTPESIVRQLLAEGVASVALVSEDPKQTENLGRRLGVENVHRDEMDPLQMRMREIGGVSAIVYVQVCAAEKRRRRKRDRASDPNLRYMINPHVCEGCGDCTRQSSCISIGPRQTALGVKREINQSSCNKDFSCAKGFCPSFVSIKGGRLRRQAGTLTARPAIAEPEIPALSSVCNILVAGIGGTGVVTVGAVLAMAAQLDGCACTTLDLTGLSQKNGAVSSHLRLARSPAALHAPRIGAAQADILLGCDIVAASSAETRAAIDRQRTRAVINLAFTPTSAFLQDPSRTLNTKYIAAAAASLVEDSIAIDAHNVALRTLGDAMASNFVMVGAAWQAGMIPLTREAILRAIQLNGVAVDMNLQAFEIGRHLAGSEPVDTPAPASDPEEETLQGSLEFHAEQLRNYQDTTYAERYLKIVERVRARDEALNETGGAFTRTVARNLFRLMAYKDEYEVARLLTSPAFAEEIERTFEGDYRIAFNLAPPILGLRDAATGEHRKIEIGAWLMPFLRILSRFRRLRGTWLDPFGWTRERRTERALVQEYEAVVDIALSQLGVATYESILTLVDYPEGIRGYGHVKLSAIQGARSKRDAALAALGSSASPLR